MSQSNVIEFPIKSKTYERTIGQLTEYEDCPRQNRKELVWDANEPGQYVLIDIPVELNYRQFHEFLAFFADHVKLREDDAADH